MLNCKATMANPEKDFGKNTIKDKKILNLDGKRHNIREKKIGDIQRQCFRRQCIRQRQKEL